jgi:trimeric autotransporter adhesin
MKKLTFFIILTGLLFAQNGMAQSPVSFPDGVIVGNNTIVIPSGSTYKLAVGGGIIAEKVRVATSGTTSWADYVFDKGYKLRSLSDLDRFIKINKHLPDTPTTAEVTENGIDLAQTQVLLLQKIEELTLYMISQNKKITHLERKIKNLSQKTKK